MFKALGYQVPDFYHVPLIHGDDGAKLSKRHGATSVIDFQREGFSPDVMVNHLARLGFGFSTNETMPLNQLIEEFDPNRIGKSKSQIGFDALYARNRAFISQMPLAALTTELTTRAAQVEVPFEDGKVETFASLLGPKGLEALADASKGRASTFQEALELGMLTLAPPDVLQGDVTKFTTAAGLAKVREALKTLEGVKADAWDLEHFKPAIAGIDKGTLPALRWMLTGAYEGFPLENIVPMLGRDETLARIKAWTERAP